MSDNYQIADVVHMMLTVDNMKITTEQAIDAVDSIISYETVMEQLTNKEQAALLMALEALKEKQRQETDNEISLIELLVLEYIYIWIVEGHSMHQVLWTPNCRKVYNMDTYGVAWKAYRKMPDLFNLKDKEK